MSLEKELRLALRDLATALDESGSFLKALRKEVKRASSTISDLEDKIAEFEEWREEHDRA